MDKMLTIDGKQVGFRATARTPRFYRHKFGRDIIQDVKRLEKNHERAVRARGLKKPGEDADAAAVEAYENAVREAQLSVLDLEIFENCAYIMARQFDPSVPTTPEDWLDSFSVFSIYEILPEILELWNMNQKTTSTPKKK